MSETRAIARSKGAVQVRDVVTLLKPRISSFVVLAAGIGALLAEGPGGSLVHVVGAALLVGATAAASCALNQVLERDLDRLMRRTAQRPLAAGRMSVGAAVALATALMLVGVLGLAVFYDVVAALLSLATLVAYVLVYTPLKRHSSFNTVIGAVPGAMPPLLGYVAVAGEPGPWGWMLFASLFVWQFPHFLAIAWMHREDYRRAGMRMLPALDGAAGLAGRQAFLYALVLLPVSLLPAVRGDAGPVFAAGALLLGAAYAGASALFALRESQRRARAVLFVSLAYLPLLFSLALLDPVVALVRAA